MQQWEYLFLKGSGSLTGFIVEVNGKKWRNDVSIMDFLNQKGEEGWELVFTDVGINKWPYFILKRPLP
jgi:hypothetical protein